MERSLEDFLDYIGPDNGSDSIVISQRMAEVYDPDTRPRVCTCCSEPERPRSPISLPPRDDESRVLG